MRKEKVANANYDKEYFSSSKGIILKSDLNEYLPDYPQDLEKVLEDKSHIFMKNHFSPMYNIENFYLYIKMNNERKMTKLGSIIFEEKLKEIKSEVKCQNNLEEIIQENIEEIMKIEHDNKNEVKEKNTKTLVETENNVHLSIDGKTISQPMIKKIWDCNMKDTNESKIYFNLNFILFFS
jgi:nitrogenase subunit NifH